MRTTFHVKHTLAPKQPSLLAGRLMGSFGLDDGVLGGMRTYVEPFTIDIDPGQIVLFCGTSGGGKTSCLRQFADQHNAAWLHELQYDPAKMVVEQLGDDLERGMEIAGMVGLSEVFLMVRYPHELSDGQRYRFLMAKAIADGHSVLACDEFLATLDRVSAKVIAFNLRKLVIKYGLTFACATTHEDIIDDLQADYVVYFDGNGATVTNGNPVKKKSPSIPICTLQEGLVRIGTTSNNGTTGVTTRH